MEETLLLEALYSWGEFWQTVETAWITFGDPRQLAKDQITKWENERIQVPHGGWFAWPMPVAPLAHMSEQDINRVYKGQVMRYWAIYDHAQRVTDWLGIGESNAFAWWLFAYVGGDMRKLLPFIQHRVPGMIDLLLKQLTPAEWLVVKISKDKIPMEHPDASPPDGYNLLDSSRKPKYPFFDSNLFSLKYRQGLMPEPLDDRTIRQIRAITKAFGGGVYDPDEELRKQRDVVDEETKATLKHPLYKLIHTAKFHTTSSTADKLRKITELTCECHEGQTSIKVLLQWAWESEQNKELRQELSLASEDGIRFKEIRYEVANKIYRQVYAWFRRRGWQMPRPPSDWRNKIIKL